MPAPRPALIVFPAKKPEPWTTREQLWREIEETRRAMAALRAVEDALLAELRKLR